MPKVNKTEVKKVIGSILGGEEEKELDLAKSHAKFTGMYKQAKRYSLIFDKLASDPALVPTRFDVERDLIRSYANLIHKEIEDKFEKFDLSSIQRAVDCYPIIPKEYEEKVLMFLKYFNTMKKSSLIHTISNTGVNIIDYRKYLEDSQALDPSFLTNSSMMTFAPVQDLNVNFKLLYISMDNDRDRKYLLMCLHKIFDITKCMYQEKSKVDIDTGAFVKAVYVTVDKLKGELPGCDLAFKKILDSTEILTNNYESYYKDYVGSNNSMVIAENFIQDVAKNVDKSPRLAGQFQKIMSHLRKLTAQLSTVDPKYKKTMDTLMNYADKSYREVKEEVQDMGPDDSSEGDDEVD